ncbi:uncharacterized protein LOC123563280 [Mercenaria mercenaria]|uniref:uncharacterized protein LOC123563280 n=1 Tax=Mercenaria mercenaria TaxID=6596 RepID=UPI001E1D5F28|nr:uncharacterized protein LOC123563280 [Mercenaria mercenaria]
MANFNERYKAAMVLGAVGDSLGYRNGQWLECTSGRQIYTELTKLNLEEINVKPPEWKTSACTIMHISTAYSLAKNVNKIPNKELFRNIATSYKMSFEDINGRHPDETCLNSCKILRTVDAVDGYIVPFDDKGFSNAAAVRTMCLGLMHHNPDEFNQLIAKSVECGRMTHHHPTGYLGALTTALFTSFAIQRKPIEQWGHALLDTLPVALEYIRKTGIAVKENDASFGDFTKVWENHLKRRNIASGNSQANFYNRFDFEKNDEYYRSISLDGIPGSSGFDAPLIAYDAILFCNRNWLNLCVGAICNGGYSNVTGCIAGCWYGALYGYQGVNERNYSKVEFKTKSQAIGDTIQRLSYPHYDIYIHTLEGGEMVEETTMIYERVQQRANDVSMEVIISKDEEIDITEAVQKKVSALRSNVTSEEGVKIGNAIFVHVKRFIDEVGKLFPEFRASEIIKVGSFYEGTKIKCADEFDFIIVLADFSKPGSIVIKGERSSYESITIQHELFCDCSSLSETSTHQTPASRLYIRFASVFYQVVMNKGQMTKIQAGFITMDEDEMVELPTVDGLQMKVRLYRAQFPNIILQFVYKKMQVCVDLTLALEYFDIKDCLNMESIPVHELKSIIQTQKTVLFVVYDEIFRPTLTPVEVEYIRNSMLQKHKIIYMLLKYINGMYAENNFLEQAGYQPFSSYMLKTICLYHEHTCTTPGHKSYDSCLSAILYIMKESIENGYLVSAECINEICVGYLPSVFDIKRNLYNQPRKTVDILVELRKCMVCDLKSVFEHGRKWQNLEDFDKEIKLHIEKSVESVCTKTWSDFKYLLPVYRKPPA